MIPLGLLTKSFPISYSKSGSNVLGQKIVIVDPLEGPFPCSVPSVGPVGLLANERLNVSIGLCWGKLFYIMTKF